MAGSFKKRAERGYKYLNDLLGPEWQEDIDKDTLDMQSETECIFGQKYGKFDVGYNMICQIHREKYKVPENAEVVDVEWWTWLTKHGFALFSKPDEDGRGYTSARGPALRKRYAALTQAWKDLLGGTTSA